LFHKKVCGKSAKTGVKVLLSIRYLSSGDFDCLDFLNAGKKDMLMLSRCLLDDHQA